MRIRTGVKVVLPALVPDGCRGIDHGCSSGDVKVPRAQKAAQCVRFLLDGTQRPHHLPPVWVLRRTTRLRILELPAQVQAGRELGLGQFSGVPRQGYRDAGLLQSLAQHDRIQ